jgi:hypothetical protein
MISPGSGLPGGRKRGSNDALSRGTGGEAARRIKALAFRPATGYAFPVVYHATWHSVAPTSDADGERSSLMLTYYVQNGVVDRLAERAKRLWVFFAYAVRR